MQGRQLQLETLSGKFRQSFAAGRHEEALGFALQATRIAPQLPVPRSDVAVCMIKLRRWQEAIEHARLALRLGPPSLATLDALAHANGKLGHWDEVRAWGRKALAARQRQFGGPPALPHPPPPLPPPPSPATRAHNVIAFSLYGASPKYCETAVLNVTERARFYPDWTCHFYVDGTVPRHVLRRLCAPGSMVFRVDAEEQQWPGPMWRMLAYDTPELHRVIFRDADSLIGAREAAAVAEWIDSGARFHHLRDAASHTELLLAGLWGCIGGALPQMRPMIDRFLARPLVSRHFADQYFLRELVWPYARQSLLQHDSLFGFLDARPFPDGPRRDDFHVGSAEGGSAVGMQADFADGTPVVWTLFARRPVERAVCSYPAVCRGGRVTTELPRRWAQALAAGEMLIRIEPVQP
jgi:hypothetical protein